MEDLPFDPTHAQLIASNLYLCKFTSPKMGLGELPNFSFSTKVRYQLLPADIGKGIVAIYLEAYITLDDYESAGYAIGNNFGFSVVGLENYMKQTKNGKNIQYEFGASFEQTLAAVSYSTLRGISIPPISQSAYRGLFLPIVHPDQILSSERIPLKEIMKRLKPLES